MGLGAKQAGDLGVAQAGKGTGGDTFGEGVADETLGLGDKLIFDDDGDTYLSATSDDTLRMIAGGGANTYLQLQGSNLSFVTGGIERFRGANAGLVLYDDLTVSAAGGSDIGSTGVGVGDVYLDQTKRLILDDDADSYIYCSADDRMKFFVGSIERMEIFGANIDIANNVNLRPATAGGTDLGAAGREFGPLYLKDQGAYTTAVSEVAPTAPSDGHVLFSATNSAAVRELWVLDDGGTYTQLV